MKWTRINDEQQLDQILKESEEKAVLIFKHSSRCNISRATLDRLERNWREEEMAHIKPYFLDLLSYRAVSQRIAETFQVEHESPQVLIIKNQKSTYNTSHFEIDYHKIREAAKN